MPLVEVVDLGYRYPDGLVALSHVSFTLAAGECVALVGPNGAGKSTLLWHLNGLLPDRLRDGHHHHRNGTPHANHQPAAVRVDGMEVSHANLPRIRRAVGLLFQDPDDQLFGTTVGEDVAFGPLNLGLDAAEVRRRVDESLAVVGLSALADRVPHHLSMGERKRACLAGIIACEPKLLALDEPTANLDPRAGD